MLTLIKHMSAGKQTEQLTPNKKLTIFAEDKPPKTISAMKNIPCVTSWDSVAKNTHIQWLHNA